MNLEYLVFIREIHKDFVILKHFLNILLHIKSMGVSSYTTYRL